MVKLQRKPLEGRLHNVGWDGRPRTPKNKGTQKQNRPAWDRKFPFDGAVPQGRAKTKGRLYNPPNGAVVPPSGECLTIGAIQTQKGAALDTGEGAIPKQSWSGLPSVLQTSTCRMFAGGADLSWEKCLCDQPSSTGLFSV